MKEEIITAFDTLDVAEGQAEFLMESWEDHGFDKKPTKEEALEQAYGDSDIYQWAWDNVKEELTEAMTKMRGGKYGSSYWVAEGRNLGWLHRSGFAHVKAETGEELLHKLLPNTDVTIKIWWGPRKKSMEWRVSHHDAPTGEFYSVRLATKKEIDNGNFR